MQTKILSFTLAAILAGATQVEAGDCPAAKLIPVDLFPVNAKMDAHMM